MPKAAPTSPRGATSIHKRIGRWWSKIFPSHSEEFKPSHGLLDEDHYRYESISQEEGKDVESIASLDKRYEVIRTLGEGEFAQVKLAQCLVSNRLV